MKKASFEEGSIFAKMKAKRKKNKRDTKEKAFDYFFAFDINSRLFNYTFRNSAHVSPADPSCYISSVPTFNAGKLWIEGKWKPGMYDCTIALHCRSEYLLVYTYIE